MSEGDEKLMVFLLMITLLTAILLQNIASAICFAVIVWDYRQELNKDGKK